MMMMLLVITVIIIAFGWILAYAVFGHACKSKDITNHLDEDDDHVEETDPLLGADQPFGGRASIAGLLELPTIQLLRHGLRLSLMAASLAATRYQSSTAHRMDSRKRRRPSVSPTQTARSSIRRKLSNNKSAHIIQHLSASASSSLKPNLQQLFDLPPFPPSTPSPQTPSLAPAMLVNPPHSILIDGGVTGSNNSNVKVDDVAVSFNGTRLPPRPKIANRRPKGKSVFVNDVAVDSIALPPGIDRSSFQDDAIFEFTIPQLGRMKLIEHSPAIFFKLREAFGLTHNDLAVALSRPLILQPSIGQSGSFFLKSSNRRFLFKTLRGSEHEGLKGFLSAYLDYMLKAPESLLPRYLGCYTFEKLNIGERVLSGGGLFTNGASAMDASLGSKFTIIAMLSVYDTDLEIHQRFDFKGSNVGRQAVPGLPGYSPSPPSSSSTTRVAIGHSHNIFRDSEITLKELDFGRLLAMGKADLLRVGPDNKMQLLYQLEQDLGLLKRHSFMDYSLLIGVHRRDRIEPMDTMSNAPYDINASHTKRRPTDTLPRHSSIYSSIRSIRSAIPHQATSFFMWLLNGVNTSPHNASSPATTASSVDVEDSYVDESLPFYKRFHGGLKSVDFDNPDIEYEVYFIGLIDILQRFNLAKWLERGFKRQASFLTSSETWRVGDSSIEALSRAIQPESDTRSPTPTSPTLRPMSPVWEGVEHSVEEPHRYASRLVDYVRSILA